MKQVQVQQTEAEIVQGGFAMSQQPVSYQLTIHFNNLFAYAEGHATKTDVLNLFNMAFGAPAVTESWLEKRQTNPVRFRIAQMIQLYGDLALRRHIRTFYSSKLIAK